MTSTRDEVLKSVASLVGLPCVRAENPIGSILTLDFGALVAPTDPVPGEGSQGSRRLTVYSPWRVQDAEAIVFDWNVDGGAGGLLPVLVRSLEGSYVDSAETTAPAWDLKLNFSNGHELVVFGDIDNDRDTAWFVTTADGQAVSARPWSRPLPSAPR